MKRLDFSIAFSARLTGPIWLNFGWDFLGDLSRNQFSPAFSFGGFYSSFDLQDLLNEQN